MILYSIAIIFGLAVLIWSADRFVEGASGIARHFGMPALLIGMIIVGFGTSMPEFTVSALSALQGNPALALGNAYGSNVANIALILGVTAVIMPITAHSKILRKELPILTAITALSAFLIWDLELTALDGWIMLIVFAFVMWWSVRTGMGAEADPLADEFSKELDSKTTTLGRSVFWLILGLALLIGSSRLMVWGAVAIAQSLGVSELVIGLTIVAIGTSLPELASSITAVRKGEPDIALGNVLGSNMFNTLGVVGLAVVIRPFEAEAVILTRDLPVMCGLTLSLFVICYRYKDHGRINRVEGALLILVFVAYNAWIFLNP